MVSNCQCSSQFTMRIYITFLKFCNIAQISSEALLKTLDSSSTFTVLSHPFNLMALVEAVMLYDFV